MHKKLTVQPRNVVQVHNVRVEAVSEMSTGVDLQWVKKHPLVETVSEMSVY